MKKLLAILAVCFVAVSCQWWHETFDSPAECGKWYAEQIADAIEDGDMEEATEIAADFEEYVEGLSEKEQLEALEAFGGAALASAGYGDYDDYDDYDW